jgi:hypothetical protein
MTEKISRITIEASIVFVSIFTTLSLLFGAVSNEFKSTYFYLGYMLYYSLPFILACFFGIMSIIPERVDRKIAEVIEKFQIAFFLTGLMMTVWLATSAAQTALLPTVYVFSIPYFALPYLEFFVFALFSISLLAPTFPEKKITLPFKDFRTRVTNELKSHRKIVLIGSPRSKLFIGGFLSLYC